MMTFKSNFYEDLLNLCKINTPGLSGITEKYSLVAKGSRQPVVDKTNDHFSKLNNLQLEKKMQVQETF